MTVRRVRLVGHVESILKREGRRHETNMILAHRKHAYAALLWLMMAVAIDPALASAPYAVRDAFDSMRSTMQQSTELTSAWSDYLQWDQLTELVAQDEVSAEDVKPFVEALSRVERELDPYRVQTAASKLNAVSEDAAAAAESVRDLKDWLEQNRLRTWQQLLELDDVTTAINNADFDQATIVDTRAILFAEDEGQFRRDRVRLRRALSDWRDELEVELTGDMAQTARQLKHSFHDISQGRVNRLRQRARDAVQRLDAFLRTGPEARRTGWRNYLRLQDLVTELNRYDRPMLRPILRSYQKFASGQPGLEMKQFNEARQALQDYIQALRLAPAEQTVASQQNWLRESVNGLEQSLMLAGEKKEQNWKRFLRWNDLNDAANGPSPDPRRLARLISLFNAEEDGLELAPFTRVKRELTKYAELVQQTRGPQAIDRYRAQLELLARSLEDYSQAATATTAAELTERLEWLRSTGYAQDLAYQVKSAFRRRNFFVSVDGQLMIDRIADTRNEATPVNRCFEGAHVTGCARTAANFTGQLLPCNNGIAIDILVRGTTVADTVGRQRRVSVFTQGITSSTGSKRLFIDVNGIASAPAIIRACTRQSVCGINVNRRCGRQLITRFASRRTKKTIPKAESMANRETRDTLASRLDRETGELLAKSNRQFREQMATLRQNNLYPDEINLSSSRHDIFLTGMYASESYLGAPTDPPNLSPSGQVRAQVHESLINNVVAKQMGGRYIDNELIVDMMRENGLEVPDELLPPSQRKVKPVVEEGVELEDEAEPWSMTFDRRFPVIVRIVDEGLSIAVRGRKFTNAEQQINELIEISALYRLNTLPDGTLEAIRDGKVDIQFVNTPGRLSNRQITYKTFLQRKMDPLFRERFGTEDLPETGQLTEIVDAARIVTLATGNGWLNTTLNVDADALSDLFPLD
jgi:hypothetical protein